MSGQYNSLFAPLPALGLEALSAVSCFYVDARDLNLGPHVQPALPTEPPPQLQEFVFWIL